MDFIGPRNRNQKNQLVKVFFAKFTINLFDLLFCFNYFIEKIKNCMQFLQRITSDVCLSRFNTSRIVANKKVTTNKYLKN